MASTYTLPIAADLDRVRLLISDVGGEDGSSFLYDDGEINSFIDMASDVFAAAAIALRAIAGNEAQVSKRITFLELKTDGPAVAKELRELADKYDEKSDSDDEGGGFEIAHMGSDIFAERYMAGLE